MTLLPVAHAMTPRPKQATRLRYVCIYAHAGVPLTGTLTPLLHLTTSHFRRRTPVRGILALARAGLAPEIWNLNTPW